MSANSAQGGAEALDARCHLVATANIPVSDTIWSLPPDSGKRSLESYGTEGSTFDIVEMMQAPNDWIESKRMTPWRKAAEASDAHVRIQDR